MSPEDTGGADPDEPRDGAYEPRDHSPSEEQIESEPTAEPPRAHQPVQPSLPGMEVGEGNDWDRDEFLSAIEFCAEPGLPFNAADVRRVYPHTPPHPNRIGLAFAEAARLGLITPIGAIQSPLRSRRRGLCRVWRSAA